MEPAPYANVWAISPILRDIYTFETAETHQIDRALSRHSYRPHRLLVDLHPRHGDLHPTKPLSAVCQCRHTKWSTVGVLIPCPRPKWRGCEHSLRSSEDWSWGSSPGSCPARSSVGCRSGRDGRERTTTQSLRADGEASAVADVRAHAADWGA